MVRNGTRMQYTAQHEQQVRARTASVWLRRAGPCGSGTTGTSGTGKLQAVLPAAIAGPAAGEVQAGSFLRKYQATART